MTIKPLVSQKVSEKKENHGHQDAQTQNLGQNVRNNHRNVIANKIEGQSTQRRGDKYDEIVRHRRSPNKSGRSKREQREQKVCTSSQFKNLAPCNTSHTSSAAIPKQNSIGNCSPSNQTTNSIVNLEAETISGYNSGDEHIISKEPSLTLDEWNKRDEKFVKMMSERGFTIKDIIEDGACLFRAISLQIYGDQEMHEVVRQQTMDYILENREYFAHFVTEDITNYVSRKRNKESHGNHIEIQAISEIYNRPVELYCYQITPINIFNARQVHNGYDPLRLSYQRGSHYNAILDPYNASVGVGLGLAGYKPESQTREAIRLSEELEIEKTMFEDKLKTTDWEATNEAIEEQIARESYIQWCRENVQKVQKVSANSSTSSTVTSAEANQSSFNNSDTQNIPESVQYLKNNTNNNNKLNDDTNILEKSKLLSKTGSKDNISHDSFTPYDSDDTDRSSTSSVDIFNLLGMKSEDQSKVKTTGAKRRQKRRRKNEVLQSANKSIAGNDFYLNKRFKHEQTILLHENYCQSEIPGTSKENTDSSIPVSQFYQSLLESSYADDGIGQLTENEMVLKAIQVSRIDFLDEQQRKFNQTFHQEEKDDEDSDFA